MVNRKDDEGFSLNCAAPSWGPKGVKLGLLVSELELSYLADIAQADWSQLAVERLREESDEKRTRPGISSDETGD